MSALILAAKLPFRENADGLLRLNGPSLIQFISIFLHAKKAGTRKSSPAKGKEKSRCSCDVLQIHNALPVPNLGSLYPPDVQNASFFLRGLLLFWGHKGFEPRHSAATRRLCGCFGSRCGLGHTLRRDKLPQFRENPVSPFGVLLLFCPSAPRLFR